LGLSPDVSYLETTVRGDRATFISDGILEAANGGSELFGFDRMLRLSQASASEIAKAATTWGQNDDITGVTVRRLAA